MKIAILWLIVVTTILVSCQSKRNDAFKVSGIVEHANGNKILLEELPFGGAQPIVFDSTTLSSNGSFELKGFGKEEGLFLLSIQNGPEVLMVNDGNEIKLKLDINNYKKYSFEGSPASNALHDFFEIYSPKYEAIINNYMLADSLQKQNASDSLINLAMTQKEKLMNELNEYESNVINTSLSPAVRYYVLGKAFKTMQPEKIKLLTDVSVEKFRHHDGLLKLKQIVDGQLSSNPRTAFLAKQAPNFTLQDTSNHSVSLKDFRGKYVLLDFWASWCRPCREENPNVLTAYKKFHDKNFTILGVSLDSSKADWIKAINDDSLTWNHVSELKQWEGNVVKTYQVNSIPFNLLIDPNGKVIATDLRGVDLQQKLTEVLK